MTSPHNASLHTGGKGAPTLIQADPEGVVAMSVVKSFWASVQGDPVFMRRINGWLTIFWIVMIPVSLATGWVSSVVYVSALSLWALVSGHWSAWQAARVEVAQRDEERRREQEDMASDVVNRLVEQTNVEPADDMPTESADSAPAAPAGWYEQRGQLRWWTGTGWSSRTSPLASEHQPAAPGGGQPVA